MLNQQHGETRLTEKLSCETHKEIKNKIDLCHLQNVHASKNCTNTVFPLESALLRFHNEDMLDITAIVNKLHY